METIKFFDNADELHEITLIEQKIHHAAPYRIELDGEFYATAEHYAEASEEIDDILKSYRFRLT